MSDVLRNIKDYETGVRDGSIARIFRQIGPTRLFAAIYRHIGPTLDPWLMRRVWGRHILQSYGLPVMVLITTGAKSGQRRATPLVYLREGDGFVVTGTNWGQGHHPAWSANLLAHPDAEVQVGPWTLPVRAEVVDGPEWERLYSRFKDLYAGYSRYLERAGGRQPRVFVLRPLS